MKIKCTLLILMLILIGCVRVNKTLLNPSPTDKLFIQSEVRVYFESDEIPEYTRVAFLAGKGNDFADESDFIEKFKKEAGKLGANAIILEDIADPGLFELLSILTNRRIETGSSSGQPRAMAIYVPSLDDEKR